MKKSQKFKVSIVVLTAVVMLLSAVACGKKDKAEGTPAPAPAEQAQTEQAAASPVNYPDSAYAANLKASDYVTPAEYKGIAVEAKLVKATAEEIMNEIEQVLEARAELVEVNGRDTVQEGDTVNIDYQGTKDGVAFDGGTAENQTLKIGSHTFIPGFEEQMIGMNLGEEKDLQVKFPEEYHAEELKGKDAVFHVKVNGIQATEKPELDDDFAADISEFDTFAAYKESIVKELSEQIRKNNDIAAENALVEKAVENAEMDVPQAMIDDQAEYMVREMAMRMSYQGLKMEDYLKYTGQTVEGLKAMYKPEAEKRVKTELVIDAIRKAEAVEPGEAEIEKAIADQAERSGQDVETFKKNLTDEQKDYLKDNAAIQMVLDIMKKGAKILEKKEEKAEAEKPAKKPAAKKTTKKAEAADSPAEEKPVKKPAAKKTTKKAETAEAAAEEAEAKKPAKKTAAKKKNAEE